MHTNNPTVEYLNSLRTQQQSSNSTYIHEARRDFLLPLRQKYPWFPNDEQLHVRTRLDVLVDDIVSGTRPIRLLILTGDAGDGKTAFCAALARRLGFDGELKWETVIGFWRLIKDASEVEEEVLAAQIETQLSEPTHQGLIVAINEGRLRRLFRLLSPTIQELWTRIVEPALEGLDAQGAVRLDEAMRSEKLIVVNFRHRFHVRTVTPALLTAWTAPALWEDSPACSRCPSRASCSILANVRDLRLGTTQERVADVLAYSHFSGHRLPFRRLQAVLATATTGGLSCADVQGPVLSSAPRIALLRHRYYNVLFLRTELGPPVAVRPEPIARSFAPADPQAYVTPDLDRRIGDLLSPQPGTPQLGAAVLPHLEAEAVQLLRQRLSPGAAAEDVQVLQSDLSRLTRYLRRWAMFVEGVATGLRWRRALTLIENYVDGRDEAEELRRSIVEAINRLHRVEEVKTETITGNQIDAAGFRVPARQVLELNLGTDFSTVLRCGPTLPEITLRYLEGSPTEVHLAVRPRNSTGDEALLRLDARLVEILLSVKDGFVTWQGLGAHRRALARFHSRMLALAAQSGHSPVITIRAADKRYSVSVESVAGSPKLRFEGQG